MSVGEGSIFKPRHSESTVPHRSSGATDNQAIESSNYGTELTKTQKYCVTKLPAFPSVLEGEKEDLTLNGYADNNSKHALVINKDSINVWRYDSTDPSPLSIQFPLDDSFSLRPLAIFTLPSSGTRGDPGLVIINSGTGLIRFYDSVQQAPALGLINDKSLELKVPINTNKGEYITLAENTEPAGIIFATSWKRCVLVSLRDNKGKPSLSYTQLLSPSISTGLFGYFLGTGSDITEGQVDDEIVSIRSGNLTDHGHSQEISVQEANGKFHLFSYTFVSPQVKPSVLKKKSFTHNLGSYLENNIDGFLPGANFGMKFLDLWPVSNVEHERIYLSLCMLKEINSDFNKLILISLKIDESGVLTYGTHKLLRGTNKSISFLNKPKLFIPKPGKTAFVIVDNCIVLTDIDVSCIKSSSIAQYYKPRWEDIIKLKDFVDIIGLGYEDQSGELNPSIIILTTNCGVLRLEKFRQLSKEDMEVDGMDVPDSNYSLVKSHIEQGIFYDDSNAIDFDVMDYLLLDNVGLQIENIVEEIKNSKSPYLPDFMPSISDLLHVKSQVLRKLQFFVQRNFKNWKDLTAYIVENIEKVEVAYYFWNSVNHSSNPTYFLNILKQVILQFQSENDIVIENTGIRDDDVIREFFNSNISSINLILSSFIEELMKAEAPLSHICIIIVASLFNGVLKVEKEFIVGNDIPKHKLWVFDTSIIVQIEEVFTKSFCGDQNIKVEMNTNLVGYCELLYYLVNSAIHYMEGSDTLNSQLKEYRKWYICRLAAWIEALISRNLVREAISITETYHAFYSLAQILEAERENLIEAGRNASEINIYMSTRYTYYFDRFGYECAREFFDYHTSHDNPKLLFTEFSPYQNFINQYFKERSKKTSEISWIEYIVEGDMPQACHALIDSTQYRKHERRDNLELKFSLAKLAAMELITDKTSSSINNRGEANSILNDCENNLKLLRIIKKHYNNMEKIAGFKVGFDSFKSFLTKFIYSDMSLKVLKETTDLFLKGERLDIVQSINLLTLVNPKPTFQYVFADAFELVLAISDTSLKSYYSKTIWLRLLTMSDDWSELSKIQNMSDDYVKEKVKNSILYVTLSLIDNGKIDKESLDVILTGNRANLGDEEEPASVKMLNDKLYETLDDYLSNYNLENWVHSVANEINLKSSSS